MEGLDGRLILLYTLNFLILFAFLRWILYKPVRKFLSEREARFSTRVEDVELREREAEQAKEKYDALMQQVQAESDSVLRDARAQANRRAEQILADAEKQANDFMVHARKEIADEQRLARQQLREELVDLAADMASRILEREVTAEDHKRIVERFISRERVG